MRAEYRQGVRATAGVATSGPLQIGQVEAFLQVVQDRSFVVAAAALHLSQPALSRRVAGLENAVGLCLLERKFRHVTPTPAGQRLMRHFRQLLCEHNATLEAIRSERSRNEADD